ncbi:hypothetical protein ACTXT7_006776 [Hymenolepis weldensis]
MPCEDGKTALVKFGIGIGIQVSHLGGSIVSPSPEPFYFSTLSMSKEELESTILGEESSAR